MTENELTRSPRKPESRFFPDNPTSPINAHITALLAVTMSRNISEEEVNAILEKAERNKEQFEEFFRDWNLLVDHGKAQIVAISSVRVLSSLIADSYGEIGEQAKEDKLKLLSDGLAILGNGNVSPN